MVRSSPSAGASRVLIAAPLVSALLLGATATAYADPPTPPQSGDDRATVVPGNVTTCAAANLPGHAIDVTSTIDQETYITITAIPDGVTISGVVVKGSDAYNLYRNLSAWTRLHSPLAGKSGQPATISHWFACGTGEVRTTTKSSTPTTTKSAPATSTARSTSAGGVAPAGGTSNSSPAVAAASNNGQLANTGFGAGWLVGLAAALLLGGGAVLAVPRLRSALRRRG
jgi:hypothetical protein